MRSVRTVSTYVLGVEEFHEWPAPTRNPGRAKVRWPREGWELQWDVTDKVTGPSLCEALAADWPLLTAMSGAPDRVDQLQVPVQVPTWYPWSTYSPSMWPKCSSA